MMNNVSKRKSISLFLIIFIILLIVVLVILANKLLQNNNSSETENTAPVEISIESNDNTSTFNNVENISDFNEISTTTENPSNTSTSNKLYQILIKLHLIITHMYLMEQLMHL